MKEVFKVMSYATNEAVVENLPTYLEADRYILSRQNPNDYYVAWDEVEE